MTVATAIILLIFAVAALVWAIIAKPRKAVRIVCIVISAVIALGCAAYIALAILLVNGIQNQPPTATRIVETIQL